MSALGKLRGFDVPVNVFRVSGEGRAESRFQAPRTAGLIPLVGREGELGLLLERWSRAKEGDGQVVLLDGEPGIGKSRVVQELRDRFRIALEIAGRQKAKSLGPRAAMSLARLLGKDFRPSEAHAVLAHLCSWFVEGSDTADHQEARVLLGELGS